jgi:5,10-methylenetetrahydromethanopterin reductase
MRIGINLSLAGGGRAFGVDELVDQVARIHHDGFAFASFAQIMGIDALTAIAVAGRVVPEIEFLTAVIPIYPRHPIALAQQALTAQNATGGRLTLGIGLSHKPAVENTYGMSFERPVEYLREYLAILQPLLHGQPSASTGKRLIGQTTLTVPAVSPPPVIIAALGEKMLRLTGEQADGTATWMVGPKTLEAHITPVLRQSAESAGRPAPRIIVGLPICVTSDVDAARARAARSFERYGQLPSYKAMLEREGVSNPAEVLIAGSESQVEHALVRVEAAGATDFNATLFGSADDQQRTLNLLRAQVTHDRAAAV